MPKKLTGKIALAARLPKGFTEKSANVNGVRINYKIGGRGSVVVLIHGYAQTSHMWTPLMPLLAMSHTVIAPDLRGAEALNARRMDTTRRRWQRTFEVSYISSAMNRCRWLGTTSA